MTNNIEPLPFHKEPLFYTGILAIFGLGIFIYGASRIEPHQSLMTWSIIIAMLFGALTYFMWKSRCPHCKRPFMKKEDFSKEKDLGIKKIKREFISKIYLTKEGKKVKEVKDYKIWPARFIQRFYYCEFCGYGKNNEWHDNGNGVFKKWEDDSKWVIPKPQKIKVRKNEEGEYVQYSKDRIKNNNRNIVKPLSKFEAEKIIADRGSECEYPYCRENISLHIHHINPRSNGGSNKPSNLIVLCPTHHHKADRGSINATRLKLIVSKKIKKKSSQSK